MSGQRPSRPVRLIACGVFRQSLAYLEVPRRYPGVKITYLPSVLHLRPHELRRLFLAEVIAAVERGERVVCLYGRCFPDIDEVCREHGVRMYLFGEWLPGSHQALDAQLAARARYVLDNGYDGIDLHEACNFENGRMIFLQRFAQRLQGLDPGPWPPE